MGKHGKLPGLAWTDFARVLQFDGWYRVGGTHEDYKHPTKPEKVSLDKKWKDVATDNSVFHSVLRQAGWTKKQFVELYWKSR